MMRLLYHNLSGNKKRLNITVYINRDKVYGDMDKICLNLQGSFIF